MHEDVIRGYANLTRVDGLAEGYFRAAEVDLRRVIDNCRAFSSKLEDARSQIFRSFLGNDAANNG